MAQSVLHDSSQIFLNHQQNIAKKIQPRTAYYPISCRILHHHTESLVSATDYKKVVTLCMERKLQEAVDALDELHDRGGSPRTCIYECLLNSCGSERNLALGRRIYDHMAATEFKRDVYIETKVISMFVKCGSLDDALKVFYGIVDKNVYSWSVILSGFVGNDCFDEALNLLREFGSTNLRYDGFVITSALKACGGVGRLMLGKEVHGCAYRRGYESNDFVGNCLIDMYVECRQIGCALQVFERTSRKDVISWNSMLKGYIKCGSYEEFVGLFRRMEKEGVEPNTITWNTMISGSAVFGYAEEALQLFKMMQLKGLKPDVVSCNGLIQALVQSGYMQEALGLIRQMRKVRLKPDTVSWTTILQGYIDFGRFEHALDLFFELQKSGESLDEYVFTAIFRACASLSALNQGKQIHGCAIKGGFSFGGYVGVSLLYMYAKCGDLAHACKLLSRRNIVSWNSLISGHVQNGFEDKAVELFLELKLQDLKPDLVSWNVMINCLAEKGDIQNALHLVYQMELSGVKPDLVTFNTLLKGYVKNGQFDEARALLNQIKIYGFEQNASSWNTLISDYVNHQQGVQALRVFNLMQNYGVKPDFITVTGILRACILIDAPKVGKSFHALCIKNSIDNVSVHCALIDVYIKMGDVPAALKLFNRSSKRNIVVWNGLISGLAKSGRLHEAHKLFCNMQMDNLKPDIISWTSIISGHITSGNADLALNVWTQMLNFGIHPDLFSFTVVLRACADLGELTIGREIHGLSVKTGLFNESSVQSATIAMYSKCDRIEEAVCVFERAHHSNTMTWNSMISGFVFHGQGERAISLFQQMQQEGVNANWVTINGLRSACLMMPEDFEIKFNPQLFSNLKLDTSLRFSYLPEVCAVAQVLPEESEIQTKRESAAPGWRWTPSWLYANKRRHRFDGIQDYLHDMNDIHSLLKVLNTHVAEAAAAIQNQAFQN